MKREPKRRRPKLRGRRELAKPFDAGALAARIIALRDQLAPRLPDIDPSDLIHVIECLSRPFGTGRSYFLREIRPGVYVF